MRQAGSLHLISQLRCDSVLYYRYDGEYKGKGPRPKYGDRINCRHMPDNYLEKSATERGIRTHIYQVAALHECFAQPLNVVIIVKTNLQTQARAHVILFSSDLDLACDLLIDYYSLRFQIEMMRWNILCCASRRGTVRSKKRDSNAVFDKGLSKGLNKALS